MTALTSATAAAPRAATAGSDFAVLARRINTKGLMERRPAHYVARISVVTGTPPGCPVLQGGEEWRLRQDRSGAAGTV